MKNFTDKVLQYMIEEWNVDSKMIHKAVNKGLFSLIKKDEMSSESIQESAKNAALFVKDVNQEKNNNKFLQSMYMFFVFVYQGGSHMPFKKVINK